MGSLLFGEINEPSTRAFIDEETEYTEYEKQPLECEGDFRIPNIIDVLVFSETENVNKVLISSLTNLNCCCRIRNAGLEIYRVREHGYIICWSQQQSSFTTGEVVNMFEDWLKLAKKIYTVTSAAIGTYQTGTLDAKPAAILRYLTNDKSFKYPFQILEPPNLVTGLAANVLSISTHLGLKCTLFIAYIDYLPLDSVNAGPLIDVFKKIDLPVQNFNLNSRTLAVTSNLYM